MGPWPFGPLLGRGGGKGGGAARELADHSVVVASDDTARIQEAHLQILHFICEAVEVACLLRDPVL